MAKRYEIIDEDYPQYGHCRTDSLAYIERELKSCVGRPGRFKARDRVTKQFIAEAPAPTEGTIKWL